MTVIFVPDPVGRSFRPWLITLIRSAFQASVLSVTSTGMRAPTHGVRAQLLSQMMFPVTAATVLISKKIPDCSLE